AGGYHVVKTIAVGGDNGWDYITADTEGRRLYVPHGGDVIVLDLDTAARIGTITGATDVHGVAVARDLGRGFISATDPGSVTIFDMWPLPGCGQPSSMDIDRAHMRVFIGCRSGAFVVVNGADGKIVATQPIGLGVDALEFDQARGLIFVSTGGGDGALSIFHE